MVGSPILDILYGGMPTAQRAIISIPLVLYQGEHSALYLVAKLTEKGEQIACGQLLTYLFRRWNRQPDKLKK